MYESTEDVQGEPKRVCKWRKKS